MNNTLVERMKSRIADWTDEEPRDDWWKYQREYAEAADEITFLLARVGRLEAALRPFEREAVDAGAFHLPDGTLWQAAAGEENTMGMLLTVGDFRAVRDALKETNEEVSA